MINTLERSLDKPVREPENFFTLIGSGIAGLVVGEVLYVATVGRPPVPIAIMPWWFSALLVSAALVWVFREPNLWLRAALVFFAAAQALPHAQLSAALSVRWGLQAALQLALGLLLNVAFWRVARRRVKLIALAVFLLAAPIRYWTIYNWHATVDRYRQRQGVELATPSNTYQPSPRQGHRSSPSGRRIKKKRDR